MNRIAIIVACLAIVPLTGCMRGPTQEDILAANQMQQQIDQIDAETPVYLDIIESPESAEEDVAAAQAALEAAQAARDRLQAEQSARLAERPADFDEVSGAILPWIPPPFNMIGAGLIALAPLLLGRKKGTP